jgi:8-oxo-dGTP pyrophosphatase MutT (NUDIX family)
MKNIITEIEINEAVSIALEAIPSHRESPKSLVEISESVARSIDIPTEAAQGVVVATAAFLNTLGVLTWSDKSCCILAQIPDYFRRSLLWYFKHGQHILSNWTRAGVAREFDIANLLETAPYFLKILEERRLELSKQNNLDPGFSRFQPVAIVLVKGSEKKMSYFLHQWDDRAQQFQLIGGRQRGNEQPIDTAKRELHEELSEHNLVVGRDFELAPLNNIPIRISEVSRTYGALTAYEYWLFEVKLKIEKLRLSPTDRWISLEEMKNGITSTGRRIRDPHLYRLFDANIPNGFECILPSISVAQTENYIDFIEIKPGLPGIGSIDLKGMFKCWWQRRRKSS